LRGHANTLKMPQKEPCVSSFPSPCQDTQSRLMTPHSLGENKNTYIFSHAAARAPPRSANAQNNDSRLLFCVRAMLKTIYAMLKSQKAFHPIVKGITGQRPGVMTG